MTTYNLTDAVRKLIIYYRVSTARQGAEGLGMQGQAAAVAQYVAAYGGAIVAEYREVESGKKADRPELLKAIAHAKRSHAVLVIARLDRLARNVAFTANLMDSGVEFVACDNPHASRLTIHILAAVAEDEAKRISSRTSAALTAAKARGTLLGSARPGAPQLSLEASHKGALASVKVRQEQAKNAYADIAPMIREMRAAGLSLRQICAKLDVEGHTTRTGKAWNPVQVSKILEAA